MSKARLLHHLRVGLPLASGLFSLAGTLSACASTTQEEAASDSAFTAIPAGEGTLALDRMTSPSSYIFRVVGSPDEFLRAGAKMAIQVPSGLMWRARYSSAPPSAARVKQLAVHVTLKFQRDGRVYRSVTVTPRWQGDDLDTLVAVSEAIVIDPKVQLIDFAIEITDTGSEPGAAAPPTVLDNGWVCSQSVLGGDLPNKSLFFDLDHGHDRERILEGGRPVAGATLSIGYGNDRAMKRVDPGSIDTYIGRGKAFGRFGVGPVQDLHGFLEHEIFVGVSIDGVWQPEVRLAEDWRSPFHASGAQFEEIFQANVPIPERARNVQVYVHIRTFLKADYGSYQMEEKRYGDGARIQVREVWDNVGGVRDNNYDYPTEPR